jgi:hypothetical protein
VYDNRMKVKDFRRGQRSVIERSIDAFGREDRAIRRGLAGLLLRIYFQKMT